MESLPPRLSVVIIAQNEADRLGPALESVAFAWERIVVDGGSSDGTAERARALNARVIDRPFEGFVTQRQAALEAATGDWVFCLDADERVTAELREALLEALKTAMPDVDGFRIHRHNYYQNQRILHCGWGDDRVLRLVRRGRGRWVGGRVHESLEVPGRVLALSGGLEHHPYRSGADHSARVLRYARLASVDLAESGRRGSMAALLFRPMWYFWRRYFWGLGLLDGKAGLLVCSMGAWYVFLKYAFLLYPPSSIPHGEPPGAHRPDP